MEDINIIQKIVISEYFDSVFSISFSLLFCIGIIILILWRNPDLLQKVKTIKEKKMKIFAYVCNILFLIWGITLFDTEKIIDTKNFLIFTAITLLPIINIIALVIQGKGKDFLSLYFERKKLEQQKKIIELEKAITETSK